MRTFHFNPRSRAPIVSALVTGPRGVRKVRLIFDTGAEVTQFSVDAMMKVGYPEPASLGKATVIGAGGVEAEGYQINLQGLFVLGAKAEALRVGVFEMSHLAARRLDGFLGWDVIRAFHLEMDGPSGVLNVF
jgi:hypothetical protein